MVDGDDAATRKDRDRVRKHLLAKIEETDSAEIAVEWAKAYALVTGTLSALGA